MEHNLFKENKETEVLGIKNILMTSKDNQKRIKSLVSQIVQRLKDNVQVGDDFLFFFLIFSHSSLSLFYINNFSVQSVHDTQRQRDVR